MAAIGQDKANALIAAARAAGMTDEQIIATAGRSLDWIECMSKRDAACFESDVDAYAARNAKPAKSSQPTRSHPLGYAVRSDIGCTVYRDASGATHRIYDQS